MKTTLFEKHPKLTLTVCFVILSVVGFFILEALARTMGLGDVVVYESNPLYGYRPEPNQQVKRFHQAKLKFNNLGIRADEDWDPDKKNNHILFLGDSVTYGGSYIDNSELFSAIAVKSNPNLCAGNAGVNGWGVLNVYGLVKDNNFTPAQTYVSVFPEGDFYRGLNRLGGLPYWTHKPKWALEELFHYWLYKLNLKIYSGSGQADTDESMDKVVEIAVQHLEALDTYLKEQGYNHLIFITPSKRQALGKEKRDKRVKKALKAHNLSVHYLAADLRELGLPRNHIKACYYDTIHLTKEGHRVWGEIIGKKLSALDSDRG